MPKGVRGAGFVVWQLASKLMFSQHPCCQHSPKLKNSPRSSQGTVKYCEILCKSQSGLLRSVLSQIQIDQSRTASSNPSRKPAPCCSPHLGEDPEIPAAHRATRGAAITLPMGLRMCWQVFCHVVPQSATWLQDPN